MDIEEGMARLRAVDPVWMAAAAVVGVAVIGFLVWGGMEAPVADDGVPDDNDSGAGDASGETGGNETITYDGAARIDVWAPGPLTCADEEDREAVQVRRTEEVEGGIQFLVNGTIRVPNPCQSLEATVVQEGGGYVLRITSSSSGTGFCTECVAASDYTARLTVPAERLTVMHEGEVIDVLTR